MLLPNSVAFIHDGAMSGNYIEQFTYHLILHMFPNWPLIFLEQFILPSVPYQHPAQISSAALNPQ